MCYCYARPSHNYLDLSSCLDFETKLFVKTGVVDQLHRELYRPKYQLAMKRLGLAEHVAKLRLDLFVAPCRPPAQEDLFD